MCQKQFHASELSIYIYIYMHIMNMIQGTVSVLSVDRCSYSKKMKDLTYYKLIILFKNFNIISSTFISAFKSKVESKFSYISMTQFLSSLTCSGRNSDCMIFLTSHSTDSSSRPQTSSTEYSSLVFTSFLSFLWLVFDFLSKKCRPSVDI